jgi:hypothetical protein
LVAGGVEIHALPARHVAFVAEGNAARVARLLRASMDAAAAERGEAR